MREHFVRKTDADDALTDGVYRPETEELPATSPEEPAAASLEEPSTVESEEPPTAEQKSESEGEKDGEFLKSGIILDEKA